MPPTPSQRPGLSLDGQIRQAWSDLEPNRRTVRGVEALLIQRGVKTNRNRIAKVLKEHKHALAVGIVADDAVQITRTLSTLPPGLMAQVSERNSLDAIDDMLVEMTTMVVGACTGGTLQVRTVPEVAMMAQAIGGLVTALTAAREAQLRVQAQADARAGERPPASPAGALPPAEREQRVSALTLALRRAMAQEG